VLLAVFCILGLAGVRALFLNFLTNVLYRIVGSGAYIAPVMLLAAAYILLFHRGRPVKLRVWCAMLTPVWVGILIQSFTELPKIGFDMFSELWENGGVVTGTFAVLFTTLFSKPGAFALYIIGFVLLFTVLFRFNIAAAIDALRERKPVEYEERPAPERKKTESQKPLNVPRRARFKVDVPIDDEPVKKPVGVVVASPQEDVTEPPLPWEEPVAQVMAEETEIAKAEPEPEEEEAGTLPTGFVSLKNYQPGKPLPAPVVSHVKMTEPERPKMRELRPPIENPQYIFPPLDLLPGSDIGNTADTGAEIGVTSQRLSEAVQSFGIDAKLMSVVRGPSVARYEFEIAQGMTLNRLTNRADDIALALGADGVRIAPVSGKASIVGIEVPNKLVDTVYLRDVLESDEFSNAQSRLAFALGKDIGGTSIVGDIFRLTHLLVAGTTGSGKSVCVNSLIISLLYKAGPDEVKLILIDPKMVELDVYNGIPHLLIPVVTDPKKASSALQWAVYEMEKRYRLMQEAGVRDIFAYNQFAVSEDLPKVPQMVIIIDELADLMMVAGKEVEDSIIRIAQKARAAGMHLVVATQRPSADVITGLMKSNIPSRIAFTVASGMDSRIILDSVGAEKLIGKGDMLYAPLGAKMSRVQGCYVHEKEVKKVVGFVKQNAAADYSAEVLEHLDRQTDEKPSKGGNGAGGDDYYDPMVEQAMDIILEVGQASTSMLQRRLKLGYARAARVVDQLEERGLLGPSEGSKPRAILVSYEQWQEIKERSNQ
jgi:S-DNA-T family DNA segregation ATPase FtsK/SpoIIIE